MSFTWDRFHSDCRQVSNASVICEDGVIFTHKLVLANISILMKSTLKEIPPADEATIYLKDFSKEDVELFMSEMSFSKESKNTDLRILFGDDRVSHVKTTSDDARIFSTKSEVRVKDEDDGEEHLSSNIFSNSDFPCVAVLKEFEDKTGNDTKEFIDKMRNSKSNAQKMSNKSIDKKIKYENAIDKKEMEPDDLEEFDRKTKEQIIEYEKDLIENPKTEKQKTVNKKIDKKIRYEKALAAYKTGRVKSYLQAAKMYGVSDAVLGRLVTAGTSYRGKGCTLKRFTAEEEKIIAERIWKLNEGGSMLTNKMVQTIILEEAEIVQVNQPERTELMTFATNQLLWSFTINFIKRHEINEICNAESRKDLEQRRIHECEICYRNFTYQNSLVAHRRKCHSFLFNRS